MKLLAYILLNFAINVAFGWCLGNVVHAAFVPGLICIILYAVMNCISFVAGSELERICPES